MRLFYRFLLCLLLPFILLRLAWRGIWLRAYWRRWGERFGFIPPVSGKPIWIHAVSVGETQAAAPLIKALQSRYPDQALLITTMTPTSSQRVVELFRDTVQHVYLPYDYHGAVERFLERVQPKLGIILETELWPHLLAACKNREIPLILANARLSARSAARYHHISSLIKPALQNFAAIAAQGESDAQRLIALGAEPTRVKVMGNLKFELCLPPSLHEQGEALRQNWGADRQVWIAASTHEGEEELILACFQDLKKRLPELLLVLVPRHPDRFNRVAALCRRYGYLIARRSENEPGTPQTDIYLGDTLGELLLLYAASDFAFVGGSLVPVGGHNLLEPAALGIAAVTGPYTFNFEDITRQLITEQAVCQIQEVSELVSIVERYLQEGNLRHHSGEQGRRFVERNRGALAALLATIEIHFKI